MSVLKDAIPLSSNPMKKLLIAAGTLLSALALVPPTASAQDYTYDCLCLYSDPNGACIEYTCDAYQRNRRSSYYNNNSGCSYGNTYGNNYGCGNQYNNNYNSRYRMYNNNNYYDGRSNYDYYYNYSNRSPTRRYYNQYYDYPMYYY